MSYPIDPLILIAAFAVIFLALILVLVVLLQTIRHRLETIEAARAADRAPLLLQEQVEALREHVGKRLDRTADVVGSVQRSLGTLEEANRRIFEVGKDLASLQQILRGPKARGGLGELLLEDLLRELLPAEHVRTQHAFRSGERVDAAISLGGRLVSIDAKFPLENFRRLLDASDDDLRLRTRKAFVADVKRHIDAIARKYIVPDEGTYDFALMYIPAENVFYETIVREAGDGSDLSDYALRQRVIPVSPGSFFAYLQVIVLGLRGLRVEERAQEILVQLTRLQDEFGRLGDDVRLVGRHLGNANASLAAVDKRLERLSARFSNLQDAEGAVPKAEAE